MRVCKFLISLVLLTGCGLESSIPVEGGGTGDSQFERAVEIFSISATATGKLITCQLNPSIVSPTKAVEVFLEFEGTEVERMTLTNESFYTFSEYDPPRSGNIMCVAVYANAEFESEAESITPAP